MLIEIHRYIIASNKPDISPIVMKTSWHIETFHLFIPTLYSKEHNLLNQTGLYY